MEQKIIQGDCLEVMKGFADKSFDLVITSPPYDNQVIFILMKILDLNNRDFYLIYLKV